MVVDDSGTLSLPWLSQPLQDAWRGHRGHGLLVQGSDGVGVLPFALTLAQAWLCEAHDADSRQAPCGRCGSCRLVQAQLHPDLQVLLPEVLRRELGWLLLDDKAEADDKRKPSKQIRIQDVRGVIDRVHQTSARGKGKVVLVHPADAMNPQAANALLKTLEEPPLGTRLVLTTQDPASLLPTVLSRCQLLRLPVPGAPAALAWLQEQGVPGPEVLLAAANGHPLEARSLAALGISAEHWLALPNALARGQAAPLQGWPLPRVLDCLFKVCHDAMAVALQGSPRYFPAGSLPQGASLAALSLWLKDLHRVARHEGHPWNESLMLDALVAASARALKRADPQPT
jgi:DNA polymerase-3 subunit delta'